MRAISDVAAQNACQLFAETHNVSRDNYSRRRRRLTKASKTVVSAIRERQHRFVVSALYLAFLTIYNYVVVISAHSSCSYQIPEASDVVFNVPLAIESTRSSQLHEKQDSDLDVHAAHAWKRRVRRDNVLSREFKSLRIALHFDPVSIQPLSEEKQLFINSSLLPQAIGFWENALLVRPSIAPIRLSRKCKSNHYYLNVSELRPTCVERCRAKTTCGEVIVPDEHLFQCRFCARDLPNPLTCKFSGPPDGAGVIDADFLLYVSAVNSTRCKSEDTIAYAAHCQQEAELDRPIAGHVNICPNALSTHTNDQEILLSTIKHEILHALGFSAGLYAFYRHSDGRPRTKRNLYNRPLVFNRDRGYYDADNSTIRVVLRNDWWTAEGLVSHPIYLMVTERVTEEARKHFGCDRLEGAEIENQGGDGTALTHWEKRLFENEAMTGTHTQNPVYSRLTLALMEDSGWYKANYSVAEHLHWGNGLGCEFATKSCGEWIKSRLERNKTTAPFCHHIKHDGRKSLAITRCTDQRDSLALCNLIPYKKALPVEFRNFAFLQNVRKEGVKYYGGSVELADYCPYNQEFEWKSVNSTERRRDSRCELYGNAPTSSTNSVMEIYGNRSRCFDLASTWTERKCGRVKYYTQFMAGCYQFTCRNGHVNLKVHGSSYFYPCYYAGQPIYIRKIINGWLREGVIQCPACEELCAESQFWHNLNTKHNALDTGFSVKNNVETENEVRHIKNSPEPVDDALETIIVDNGENDESTATIILSTAETTTIELPYPKSPLRYGIKERREISEAITDEPVFQHVVFPGDMKCAPELRPDELFGEIGDPPLDEPCSSVKTTFVKVAFLTSLLAQRFVRQIIQF